VNGPEFEPELDIDKPEPLTAAELKRVNALAQKLYTPSGGHVVREPTDNAIGDARVLRRTDGLFVVMLPNVTGGPVFRSEKAARTWCQIRSEKKL
jgi:hypothetical protein